MEYDYEVIVVVALVVYLLVWWAMVQVLKRGKPSDDEDFDIYAKDEGIPYMKFSDMIIGFSALWPLWVVILILHYSYVIIKGIVRFLLELV